MDSPLTIIDGIFLIATFISVILAVAQGITRELLWIVNIYLSILGGAYGSVWVGPFITKYFDLSPLTKILPFDFKEHDIAIGVAAFSLFIVIWILLAIFTRYLVRWINASVISGVDRLFGGIFGLLRSLAIIGVVYIVYTYFTPIYRYPSSLKNAKTYPVIVGSADVLVSISHRILPKTYADDLKENYHAHKKNIQPHKKDIKNHNIDPIIKTLKEKIQNSPESDSINIEQLRKIDKKDLNILLEELQKE